MTTRVWSKLPNLRWRSRLIPALPLLLLMGYHKFMEYLIKLYDHMGRILALLEQTR